MQSDFRETFVKHQVYLVQFSYINSTYNDMSAKLENTKFYLRSNISCLPENCEFL